MTQIDINFFAVFAASVAHMLIGWAWYSEKLFGKRWRFLMGKGEADAEELRRQGRKAMAASFLGALVMAYVLGHFVYFVGATNANDGIQIGFWVWLGFVATTGLTTVLFEGRPKGVYFINISYYLVSLIVMGIILSLWK
jgi:hypothetical protein